MDSISPAQDAGKCPIPQEEGDCSQPLMASGGPQASQIPDFEGMPSSRHGCSLRSSNDCFPNKETFLLAEGAEGRRVSE